MTFIRIFTFIAGPEHVDLGLPINESVERVEVWVNPDFVTHIEAKSKKIGGCEINLTNGAFLYVEESPRQVAELIKKAKQHEFYSAAN